MIQRTAATEGKRIKLPYIMVTLDNTGSCLRSCVVALSRLVDMNILLYQVCTLLLCEGPIAGCSAVLAVRRYCCSYRSLVPSLRAVRKRNRLKNKKKANFKTRTTISSPGIDPKH